MIKLNWILSRFAGFGVAFRKLLVAMASGGGGESVVAFFRRLGVPNAEALKPDDLDWMLENVTNVNSDGTSNTILTF